MPEKMVAIKLLQPYGKDGTLTLRFGTEEPAFRGAAPGALETVGSVAMQDVKLFDPRRSFVQGARVQYGPIVYGDPDPFIVPESVARHYFGDWDIAPGSEGTPQNGYRGFSIEKNRVAMAWGNYQMKPDYILKAERLKSDTTRFGPPDVPLVEIHSTDARGRVTDELVYRPHEWFGYFSDDYQEKYWLKPQRIEMTQPPVVVDLGSIKDQVMSELKAEFDAQMGKPKRKPGRPRKVKANAESAVHTQ